MAKAAKTAWGIDVGNCTLKALKLGIGEEGVDVLDFAVIEHKKILSQPEVTDQERAELVTVALNQFLEEHDVSGSAVVVSVPGQSSFARFIKLPPVESKRIPELVRYEAIQQIPFEISDVEWDWQVFQADESPEIEVGIFAIKRDLVSQALAPFTQADCLINTVQMAPMALYNFLRYDQKQMQAEATEEAIITLDIGAENTDLVIADGMRVWQRSIPIGGNQFTAAVQKAFKLGFTKAEAIKRTASTSKYARQIFQAMRPVFADLAAEVQRSLGFYSSGNREVQFRNVLAMGNAIKLPGLTKFLQQSLSLPVKRLDSFESLKLTPDVSVTAFTAGLPSLGVAYGLALQGIGQAVISSNLLPREVIRQTQWQRKRRWFVAACAVFVFGGLLSVFKAYSQRSDIGSEATARNRSKITKAQTEVKKSKSLKANFETVIRTANAEITKRAELYDSTSRNLIPGLFHAVCDSLPNAVNNSGQQQLYQAFNEGDRNALKSVERSLREQVFISSIKVVYTDDLNKKFDEIVKVRSTQQRRSSGGEQGGLGDTMGFDAMMGIPGFVMPGARPGSPRRGSGRRATRDDDRQEEAEPTGPVPGFALIIEGSTPQKDELSFLYPPEVGLDRQRWGFFNRLEYLGFSDKAILAQTNQQSSAASDSSPTTTPTTTGKKQPGKSAAILPGNSFQKAQSETAGELPFETYIGAGDRVDYFDTSESGWVSGRGDADQPYGLGMVKPEEQQTRRSTSGDAAFGMTAATTKRSQIKQLSVLIDPLTFEPISEMYKIDPETGEISLDASGQPITEHHDYWFRIKIKVKLKEKDQAASSSAKNTKAPI